MTGNLYEAMKQELKFHGALAIASSNQFTSAIDFFSSFYVLARTDNRIKYE